MKPFLLLATRPEDAAADGEYDSFLRLGGLDESHLRRVRLEAAPLPEDIRLGDYAGVILGGGPFNSSDAPATKSTVQLRVEADLARVVDEVIARDLPFLGACYGVGALGSRLDCVIDNEHAEPVGPVVLSVTAAGAADPLLAGVPGAFDAFVGHKEAISRLAPEATLLVTGAACPVQMFRVRSNVYATQFHPELDIAALELRIDVYRNAGYFHPDEAEGLKARARSADVTHSNIVLRNFVERYS